MNSKTKILIGIIIVIFLIGGWWINQKQAVDKNPALGTCMPRECYTYYCDKNVSSCDISVAFGVVSRPPFEMCAGTTKYQVRADRELMGPDRNTWIKETVEVTEKEFSEVIDNKNKECGNCIVAVPQPCK